EKNISYLVCDRFSGVEARRAPYRCTFVPATRERRPEPPHPRCLSWRASAPVQEPSPDARPTSRASGASPTARNEKVFSRADCSIYSPYFWIAQSTTQASGTTSPRWKASPKPLLGSAGCKSRFLRRYRRPPRSPFHLEDRLHKDRLVSVRKSRVPFARQRSDERTLG